MYTMESGRRNCVVDIVDVKSTWNENNGSRAQAMFEFPSWNKLTINIDDVVLHEFVLNESKLVCREVSTVDPRVWEFPTLIGWKCVAF